MYVMWLNLLFAGALLTIVVGIWFGMYYWLNPRLDVPDGKARLTGSCGDTMELCLKFDGNKVAETSHWTNGCVYSLNCISSAAHLVKGKTVEEILDISPETIAESIGGLPRDHMHCATLAVDTLQEAVNNYMRESMNKPTKPFPVPRFRRRHL